MAIFCSLVWGFGCLRFCGLWGLGGFGRFGGLGGDWGFGEFGGFGGAVVQYWAVRGKVPDERLIVALYDTAVWDWV